MSSVSYQIPTLLDKMTSTDKDLRFMATNDLMSELQKDSIKLDDDCERKVVTMLLRLLADTNGEVQNLAVKCLGPLVSKVKSGQVEAVVDTLCQSMLASQEQLRDISSIALKTVVNELPPLTSASAAGSGSLTASHQQLATSISCRVIVQLCRAVSVTSDVSVQLEALDIMSDLLARFGSVLVSYHSSILEALHPQLASSRLAVRKRTVSALGHLVLSCSGELYQKLIQLLLEKVDTSRDTSTLRTYINAVAAISREAGHRFGEYLETALPLVTRHCRVSESGEADNDDDDDELREQCLLALEAFVHKCPREVTPHIPSIVELCLHFLCHDPNYNYSADDSVLEAVDDDGDDAMTGTPAAPDAEDDDYAGDDDEQDYSDDDDMSWKVRRAAAKCLDTVVSTRPELLLYLYRTVSMPLLNRFKEREENVKLDIFNVYISLLRQTKASVSSMTETNDQTVDSESPITALQQQVPFLVRVVHRQLQEHSAKTRQGCFTLLKELIAVRRGVLTEHIRLVMPAVLTALSEQNEASNMKIDTLVFLRCLLVDHPASVFHPHIARLLPALLAAVADPFYKIAAEALHVLQQMVSVIRPLDGASQFDFVPFTVPVYTATLQRLVAADLDQEVKERAISCMGQVLSVLGDQLVEQLPGCLPILLERLRNEMTRLATVRALTAVAASPLAPHLSPILSDTLALVHTFLRKNQRSLKLSSLQLLEQLVAGKQVRAAQLQPVLLELPPLLVDTDLHVAQRALALLSRVCQPQPALPPLVDANTLYQVLLPPVVQLTRSPLLQGTALRAVTEFFSAVMNSGLLPYDKVVAELVKPIAEHSSPGSLSTSAAPLSHAPLHKQAFTSISQCVAAVCGSDSDIFGQLVPHFMAQIGANNTSDAERTLALLCIGEIGKRCDMTAVPNLLDTVLSAFDRQSEEVKQATSHAIGLLTSGNMECLLPAVLHQIATEPRHQFLLLHSLKEIITSCWQSQTPLGQHEERVWQQLLAHCEECEEGTRNVVAECVGRLTLLSPERLLPRLQQLLHQQAGDRPLMKTTIVAAVKYTICDRPLPIDALLRRYLPDFLGTLSDPLPQVRRVALVTFNSAAHNKPSLVRELLDQLLPLLYAETKIRKEMIRVVEMGPFKHTVDDGLDLRKAGYECMYTLLDTCLDRLDVFTFLNHIEDGLKDDYDIKMLTYMMLVRLTDLVPNAVLQRLDRLVDPLRATCTVKVKQNSVKQEFEKQDELKRSALRVTVALMTIPDADKNIQLCEFVSYIKSNSDLMALFESVQQDSTSDPTTMMDLS